MNDFSNTSLQILSERMAGLSLTIAAIDDQLDAISAELGVIKNTTTTPRSTPAATGFYEGKTTKTITNYDYKQHGKMFKVHDEVYYDLDMTFTCNTDVFLDTADMQESQARSTVDDDDNTEYLSRVAHGATLSATSPSEVNYIRVDGRTLYSNNFHTGATYVELDTSETFNNRKLTSGMGLKFETRIYDGEFGNLTTIPIADAADRGDLLETEAGTKLIAQAMKNNRTHNFDKDNPNEISLYTVEVNWNSYSASTCSISIGGAASAIGADTPYSKTFGAEISGDSILKTFENTLDCGGNPLTITGITGASGDDDNLANFGTLGLTVLDGNNDDTADVAYKFGTDWELSEDDDSPKSLPLTVSGHDVKISGTFPGKSLIIQLEYNSVPNAGCTISP